MKIEDSVLAVLSTAETEGNALRLTAQLDRNMYVKVNKVLEAAGGKWNRKARAHIFDTDADERMDQIILSGEVEIPKDEFNYFPTPKAIVDRLIELAYIDPGHEVLEPSAGQGAIANAAVEAGAVVDCCEFMQANAKFLIESGKFRKVVEQDFLTVPAAPQYDRVVMNPPFAKQADIRHVTHAFDFLKPGGTLVAVISASVAFRDNRLTKDFRGMVEAHEGTIEELPPGSFKESGTMVNTVVVTLYA